MTTHEDKLENARAQGQAQFNAIRERVAALNCDYDRLNDLRELIENERDNLSDFRKEEAPFLALSDEEREELRELQNAAGDCEDEDQARNRIQDDALSVEVRSVWHTPGDRDGLKPGKFRILLCTGGPAVQIIGELNEYGEPERAWMQVQDWFTPWTDFFPQGEDVGETLLAYARCFYFGE